MTLRAALEVRAPTPGQASRLASILLFAAACGDDTSTPPIFTTRDSAGVEIVETTACSWDGGALSVEDEPYLSIGNDGDDVPYRFVEITHALTLPDGRIAVAEQGSGQVRVFDTEGEHLVSFGRAGDGEGEFRSITRLIWWEDRLWAFDGRRALLTSFGGLGNVERLELVAVQSPGEAADDPSFVDDLLVLDDGSLYALGDGPWIPSDAPPAARSPFAVTRLEPMEGRGLIPIPGAWGVDFWSPWTAGIGRPLAYTPIPSWATDGSLLYFTTGDVFEFVTADALGRIQRITRIAQPAPTAGEAALEAWRERSAPPTTLAIGALLADPSGVVWAYRAGAGSRDWDVFAPSGACLGTVRMPAGLTVFEIGDDYVLGRSEQHADVERVQLHRLVRR